MRVPSLANTGSADAATVVTWKGAGRPRNSDTRSAARSTSFGPAISRIFICEYTRMDISRGATPDGSRADVHDAEDAHRPPDAQMPARMFLDGARGKIRD